MLKRIILALLFMICTWLPVTTVSADDTVLLESIQIDIWPEYDRPDVLIIYRLHISPQTSLPALVKIRIPREAGGPFTLAMEDPNGALFNLSYQTQVIGDWLEISFTTPVSKVQIEYYDPRLTRNLELRSFIYRWPGDFPVQMMTVRVQKPLNAMDMRLTPNLGEPILEKDNLMYFTRTIENIVKGQPYNLQISYSKDDDSLTYSGGPVQPSEPIISASPDRVVLGHIFPWILGLLGVLLISGGLWYWQSGRTLLRRPKPATHQRRQNDPKAIILPIYCHQCGRRASLGDQFCRACGTRLRNP